MAKATMGPMGGAHERTYRAEGGTLTRGYAVIQGTAADQVALAATAGDDAIGIVKETALVGAPVSVVTFGECIGIIGSTVTAGQWLKVTTGGLLVPSAAEDKANIGRARSGATTSGDEIVVFVLPSKARS